MVANNEYTNFKVIQLLVDTMSSMVQAFPFSQSSLFYAKLCDTNNNNLIELD